MWKDRKEKDVADVLKLYLLKTNSFVARGRFNKWKQCKNICYKYVYLWSEKK